MSDYTIVGKGPTSNFDRRGRAAPGNNLRGEVKAKRQRGMSRLIAQETNNGLELATLALGIARDTKHKDQLKAIDWLTVRLCGKVPDTVEVTGKDGAPINPLSAVDVADLLALAKAQNKEE